MRKPEQYRHAADEVEADAASAGAANRSQYLELAASFRKVADALDAAQHVDVPGHSGGDDAA